MRRLLHDLLPCCLITQRLCRQHLRKMKLYLKKKCFEEHLNTTRLILSRNATTVVEKPCSKCHQPITFSSDAHMQKCGIYQRQYIYAAFKVWLDEGISRDREWSKHWISTANKTLMCAVFYGHIFVVFCFINSATKKMFRSVLISI